MNQTLTVIMITAYHDPETVIIENNRYLFVSRVETMPEFYLSL